MSEARFLVFNATDEVFATPEPMTKEEALAFMVSFRERFKAQGYYASVDGRIPISELELELMEEDDENTDL